MIKRFKYLLLLVAMISLTSCNNNENNLPQPYKYLTGVMQERRFTKDEIINMLDTNMPGLNIGNSPLAALVKDLDIASITYSTKDVNGNPIQASGIVAMLSETKSYDHLLSIQHLTADIEDAPSTTLLSLELLPSLFNHVVVLADYLGYGVSQTPDKLHPYMHVKSTGVVCADMIEAAREYLIQRGITEESKQLELMGYSQGASATVATLYELERRGQASRINAVHAGAGAYDLSRTMQSYINGEISNVSHMGFIPYILRGISYGDHLTINDANIYTPEMIDNGISEMLVTMRISKLHSALGTNIKKIIHPDFFAAPSYNGNGDIIKLLDAFDNNSLVNYSAPQNPIILYHSKTDNIVPYHNSVTAKNKWSNATLTDLSSGDHVTAGAEFILRYMGIWSFVSDIMRSGNIPRELYYDDYN